MEEIINSVMQSPENTNPNILRSQLQKMGGSNEGAVYVTITQTDTDTWTCDKTGTELAIAASEGKNVYAIVSNEPDEPGYNIALDHYILTEYNGDTVGLCSFTFRQGLRIVSIEIVITNEVEIREEEAMSREEYKTLVALYNNGTITLPSNKRLYDLGENITITYSDTSIPLENRLFHKLICIGAIGAPVNTYIYTDIAENETYYVTEVNERLVFTLQT